MISIPYLPLPEFNWENYKTIAHALGGIGDKTYLNSKESFLASYQMGCRLFEVDLVKTSDNVWVCRHSWNQSLDQWEGDGKNVLSSEEFISRPVCGKYTPMTFKDLLMLLSDYPDAFVMLILSSILSGITRKHLKIMPIISN